MRIIEELAQRQYQVAAEFEGQCLDFEVALKDSYEGDIPQDKSQITAIKYQKWCLKLGVYMEDVFAGVNVCLSEELKKNLERF